MSHAYQGEFDACQQYIEQAALLAERTGDPVSRAWVPVEHSLQVYYTGDWVQMRADLQRAVDIMREEETSVTFVHPQLFLGVVCQLLGDRGAVAADVPRMLALAENEHDLQALRMAHAMLSDRDLLEGRPEVARARLEPLLDRPGLQEDEVAWVLPNLAWAYLALGDVERAETLATASRERASADHHNSFLVDALRAQALVWLHMQRWNDAVAALEESLSLSRALPIPYAEAKAHNVYAHLHAARGERERAGEHYRAALAILTRLGERVYAVHIEQALAVLESAAVTTKP